MLGDIILMDNSEIILLEINQIFQSIYHLLLDTVRLWARVLLLLHVARIIHMHLIPIETCMLGDIMDLDNSGIIL